MNLKQLFNKYIRKWPIKLNRIHDYRKISWGHNLYMNKSREKFIYIVIIFGSGFKVNDVILYPLESGDYGSFRIMEVKRLVDPNDMYRLKVEQIGNSGYGMFNKDKYEEI